MPIGANVYVLHFTVQMHFVDEPILCVQMNHHDKGNE